MKKRGWRREIARGATMPRGYGLAWVDTSRAVAVCFPRPANWVARQWREIAWRLRRAARALRGPGREQEELASAHRLFHERQVLNERYTAGYLTGWQECYDACLEAIEDELARGGIEAGRGRASETAARVMAAGKRSKLN